MGSRNVPAAGGVANAIDPDHALYIERALSALGSPTNYRRLWIPGVSMNVVSDPYIGSAWRYNNINGTGVGPSVSGNFYNGGAFRLYTTGIVNSRGYVCLNQGNASGTTDAYFVGNLKTTKSYCAFKGAIATSGVANANRNAQVGFLDPSAAYTVGIGVARNVVASNFSIQYDGMWGGAALDLGVAHDANTHVFEMVTDGAGGVYGAIDAAAWSATATLGGTTPAGPWSPNIAVNTLTDNTAFDLEIAWMLFVVGI